jgi:hypothetical protein
MPRSYEFKEEGWPRLLKAWERAKERRWLWIALLVSLVLAIAAPYLFVLPLLAPLAASILTGLHGASWALIGAEVLLGIAAGILLVGAAKLLVVLRERVLEAISPLKLDNSSSDSKDPLLGEPQDFVPDMETPAFPAVAVMPGPNAPVVPAEQSLKEEKLREARRQLDELKAEVRADQAALEAEARVQLDELKAEVQASQAALKAEAQASQAALKAEARAQLDELKAEAQASQAELSARVDAYQKDAQAKLQICLENQRKIEEQRPSWLLELRFDKARADEQDEVTPEVMERFKAERLASQTDVHRAAAGFGAGNMQGANRYIESAIRHSVGEDASLITQPRLDGATPLFLAAEVGREKTIALLLDLAKEKGMPDVLNTPNKLGATPVYVAAYGGHLSAVQTLADLGASIHTPMYDGATPLFIAAYQGFWGVVEFLLDRGASVSAAMYDGRTPLHGAAYRGGVRAIEMLVARGADIHAVTSDGRTPLHAAAYGGQAKAVETLLSLRASMKAVTSKGLTPLAMACHEQHDEAAICLMNRMTGLGELVGLRNALQSDSPPTGWSSVGIETFLRCYPQANPRVTSSLVTDFTALPLPKFSSRSGESFLNRSDSYEDLRSATPTPP